MGQPHFWDLCTASLDWFGAYRRTQNAGRYGSAPGLLKSVAMGVTMSIPTIPYLTVLSPSDSTACKVNMTPCCSADPCMRPRMMRQYPPMKGVRS